MENIPTREELEALYAKENPSASNEDLNLAVDETLEMQTAGIPEIATTSARTLYLRDLVGEG